MVRAVVRRSCSVVCWCATVLLSACLNTSVWRRVVQRRTPVCSQLWRSYAHGAVLVNTPRRHRLDGAGTFSRADRDPSESVRPAPGDRAGPEAYGRDAAYALCQRSAARLGDCQGNCGAACPACPRRLSLARDGLWTLGRFDVCRDATAGCREPGRLGA